jgi:hypothetical protein
MLFILEYNFKIDKFLFVKVMGDADGIYNLYWQLTRCYKACDSNEIDSIKVKDLEGNQIDMNKGISYIRSLSTHLSNI